MTAQAAPSATRCGTDALAAIDRVLAEQAECEPALLLAIQCLVRLRDEAIASVRANEGNASALRRLRQANAALSLVIGTHYPLVGIKWDRLQKVRDALGVLCLPTAVRR